MYIHFTRSELIGSKLIRALTGEDISHVAIETSEQFVVHATFTNIILEDLKRFIQVNKIVRSYKYIGKADTRIWEYRALCLEGKNYDMLAFFGAGLRLLMLKLFSWYIPALGHWASKGKYICTEFVATVTGDKEVNDQITPVELEKQLVASGMWIMV